MWYRLSQIYKQKLNIEMPPGLINILKKINQKGKAFITGGAVRDAIINELKGTNFSIKDIDIEVYNLSVQELINILNDCLQEQQQLANNNQIQIPRKENGEPLYKAWVDVVGQSFGVIKLFDLFGDSFDFALPRTENKVGKKHTDFEVVADHNLTPEEASGRRDFTFNSMLYDPINEILYDYFGGQKDIQDGVIRHVSDKFSEDPLRVLRAMQFAARFNFDIAPETAELSREMAKDFQYGVLTPQEIKQKFPEFTKLSNQEIAEKFPVISQERIAEEFYKLMLKAKKPSKALDVLRQTGWDTFFPEIEALYGVPQDPQHHPEGDAWEHTKHVMDAAAKIAERENLNEQQRIVLLFSAMLHDVGKPATTRMHPEKHRWVSYGHDRLGGQIAKEFLDKIGIKKEIYDAVKSLVESHMTHIGGVNDKVVTQLANQLGVAKTDIRLLLMLIEADISGRPPKEFVMPEGASFLEQRSKELGIYTDGLRPFITREDILAFSPIIAKLDEEKLERLIKIVNEKCLEAQKRGLFSTKKEALKWFREFMANRRKYIGQEYV